MKPFKFLYLFESEKYILTEIKILDEDLPRGKKYFWLFFNTIDQSFMKLDFQNMEDGHREFKQGSLTFDNDHGIIEFHGCKISMNNLSHLAPSSSFRTKCTNYLFEMFGVTTVMELNLK